MSGTFRWRKAIAFSVLIHLFVWLTAGYAFSLPHNVPPKEELVELDVVQAPATSVEPEQAAAAAPVQPEQETTPVPEDVPVPVTSESLEKAKPQPFTVVKGAVATGTTTGSTKHSGMGTPPVVITRAYPSAAEGNGFTGIIVLRVQILETGVPGDITVAVSSGHKSLNDAAIAAARKWRFIPAKDHEGQPMVCSTIMSIPFNMKSQ